MPKSKRSKLVTLTKTQKKGREGKELLFNQIREALEVYKYVWVFDITNMRNSFLKDVRRDWNGSRLLFGRTKVMAKALGLTQEDEARNNLSKLSKYVKGAVGLLLTSEDPETVETYFSDFGKSDFPRAGQVASVSFTVPSGIIYSRAGQIPVEDDIPLPHSLESTLRVQLGVPTSLKNGKIVIENDFEVCKEGDVLDAKQTRLLKLFGIACAEFRVRLVAYWGDGIVHELDTTHSDEEIADGSDIVG
ncbi:ribosomal protein L10-domain-containing protein [Lipomyces tetrasporus]|uniref:Ribosome assembly factor mrt4 n=1 Tax=Lipomyces tetrasporus TaxID=54092 RepID=A0AAD7QWN2_9ASCO|nr:ribosomal protein L10-domain-containing protein [Lipomyces tetrasporus]KAJ8101192.1 ribosomal protein L10-domain-containing protein [Lipomyces tetrasporus]